MIEDLALRWTVTILFAISAVECAIATYGARRSRIGLVGNSIHVIMAVAMGVMAWPQGADLPSTPPMVFFLLAAGWFLVMVAIVPGARHRLINLYHVAKMSAMAWMYALMNGDLLPGLNADTAPQELGRHRSHLPGLDHQGLNLPHPDDGTDIINALPDPATSYPAAILTVNWICAIGFAVATSYWFYRYLTHRDDLTNGDLTNGDVSMPGFARLGSLCQAMMAGGMATMFGLMV